MQTRSILLPICAQALLTLLVWLRLVTARLSATRRAGVDPQVLADETRAQAIFKDIVNPSDCFENLFEMPVLFYVAALVVFVTGLTDRTYLLGAWTFVAIRAIHSWIHCTSNRITPRFAAYLMSSVVLWAMWTRLALQLI